MPGKGIALLVSLGQSYYEGEELNAILYYLRQQKSQFPNVRIDIVIADTLQVENALDPWQLVAAGQEPQDWRIEWVLSEEQLFHEMPGVIRVFHQEQHFFILVILENIVLLISKAVPIR